MKLRIIYKRGKFCCEYKKFLIWWPFEEGTADYSVEHNTLEEAEDWMKKRIEFYKSCQHDYVCKKYTI